MLEDLLAEFLVDLRLVRELVHRPRESPGSRIAARHQDGQNLVPDHLPVPRHQREIMKESELLVGL